MNKRVARRRIARVRGGLRASVTDTLAVEQPLEIVLDGHPYAVTMRLPGDDRNLALGFLFTEGAIGAASDVADMRHCQGDAGENRLHVDLRPTDRGQPNIREARVSVSSCGVCGTGGLDRLRMDMPPVEGTLRLRPEALLAMRGLAERRQAVFSQTGAAHFAALYSAEGRLLAFAEDLGRHNALDKVIGRVLATGQRSGAAVAIVSSRLSFEMVQKAGALGVQMLAGMSVATSLAADMAQGLNMTLVGGLKGQRFNIYSCAGRFVEPRGLEEDGALPLGLGAAANSIS